ncbi:MAG: ribokinase [Anaerolineae bacterium]|nr:ribokinase [Anaerolineae bacterium]
MRANICVVGSSNIDLTARVPRLPKLGETLKGYTFHLGYGGKGANQAITAAKLGAHVTMVTKLGRDVFGEDTLKNYRAHGVDTAFIRFDDTHSSGIAMIFVDDHAQNCIVIVPGANATLTPDDVRAAAEAIRTANVVVCQLETPLETTLEAFRLARAANVPTILNPAPAALLPDELLALTDICVPNEIEIEMLTGIAATTLTESERAARALLARGVRTVIVTLGERGALLVTPETAEHIVPIAVNATDPTGAGDAFIGSLAVFLGEGVVWRDAVRRANAIAALSVTKLGTQTSFPNRDEADAFCQQHGLL